MQGIIKLNLMQFALVYLLLIIVLAIMKKSKIHQTKLLLLASLRMTLQLVVAGFILTYIFENPKPVFIILYLLAMIIFSVHRVLSKNKSLNLKFKIYIAASLSVSGLSILLYFMYAVIGTSIFNPQYTIPLAGMVMGNSMTGISLGLKSFTDSLSEQRLKIEVLQNIGATPKKILLPYVNSSLETALIPTINSMLGMGIVSLPGMMTGQILSGTLPTTAIMYQIAIMIAICTAVCLCVFLSLNFGYKTLFNNRCHIKIHS